MRGHDIARIREVQTVDGFDQIPIQIVNVDAAAAKRRTRIWLRDEKEFVDRIELHVRTAVELVGGASQDFLEPGLSGEIIKLDAKVNLSRRTDRAALRIDGQPIDIAVPNAGKLVEGSRREIDGRNPPGHERITEFGRAQNRLIRRAIVSESGQRIHKILVGQCDDRTKGVSGYVRAKDEWTKRAIGILSVDRNIRNALVATDVAQHVIGAKWRRPRTSKLICRQRTHREIGADDI